MLKAFVMLLLATCVIIGAAWFMLQPGKINQEENKNKSRAEEGFLETRLDFNDKLEEFKRKKHEAFEQIGRLEQRKQAAEKRLRDAGIKTAADLEQSQTAQIDYSEIKELKALASKLQEDIRLYDGAIVRMEAGLREIDRKQLAENVAIDDEKYKQLRTIVTELNDRLIKPDEGLDQLETQQILDEINAEDGG